MGCNETCHFKFPRCDFDPLTGKCVLENQERFGYVCNRCQTENLLDFEKVFNYCILKVVHVLYLIQRWEKKE